MTVPVFGLGFADWVTIITVAATFITAVATLITVVVTYRTAQATRDTVQEMRLAREEAQKPFLVFDHDRPSATIRPTPFDIQIKNIGGGPALRCRYFCFSPQWPPLPGGQPGYLRASTFSLGAKDALATARRVHAVEQTRADLARQAVTIPNVREHPIEVILCEDTHGNRYRFVRLRPMEAVARNATGMPAWAQGWPGDDATVT